MGSKYASDMQCKAIDWILIPIIPRNIFKLHTKKIQTKYDKICVCGKNLHENDAREIKS